MSVIVRHLRIFAAVMRYCLAREMSFRTNFLLLTLTEVMWLSMLVIFYEVIFGRTAGIAGWSRDQVLLLVGTHYLVTRTFQGLFFDSCVELADLIRTGKLDFILVKPVNPQFMVSIARIDYPSFINVIFGGALVIYAGRRLELDPSAADIALYLLLIAAGVVILYSLMFLLSTSAVWIMRTQFLYEAWFHLTSFGRYPEAVYKAAWLRFLLTYVFPILVVANWPTRGLLSSDPDKLLDPTHVMFALGAAAGMFALSTWFFRRALRSYRSASS